MTNRQSSDTSCSLAHSTVTTQTIFSIYACLFARSNTSDSAFTLLISLNTRTHNFTRLFLAYSFLIHCAFLLTSRISSCCSRPYLETAFSLLFTLSINARTHDQWPNLPCSSVAHIFFLCRSGTGFANAKCLYVLPSRTSILT